jgi:hypothetical protein
MVWPPATEVRVTSKSEEGVKEAVAFTRHRDERGAENVSEWERETSATYASPFPDRWARMSTEVLWRL